jgi:putative intracellular protease/amidase
MPTNYPFPKPGTIRQIISDLLGREVTVVRGDPLVLEPDTLAVVSDFIADDGTIAAICLTDLRLSNALGAALTMVPPRRVDEIVKNRVVDEQNLASLTEIVNIMARLFNSNDCGHLKWHKIYTLPGELPEDAVGLMKSTVARRDYDVTLEAYGAGKLSVFVG